MRILFDVNVFEDIFRANPSWPVCQELVDAVAEGEIEGWILANTVHILHYFHRKRVGEQRAKGDVRDMLKGFAVLPLRTGVIEEAWEAATPDFEDNLQIEGARGFALDGIVTRNKRDFLKSPVPAYTPEELLSLVERVPSSVTGVPFLDLKAQHHQIYNEVDDGITEVISSCGFVLGKHVEAFEQAFAEFHGVKQCIAVNSGTSALHLALMALGIGPGDAVLTVPNTFIATAEAISFVGATPVFVDVDPDSYTMDPTALASTLQSWGEGRSANSPPVPLRASHLTPKAIIPVHLYGQPADMAPILQIAREYNLKVIEDACQAHGARVRLGDPMDGEGEGTTHHAPRTTHHGWVRVGGLGDMGCFSFYPGKNLGAYGEGGAVTTNDEELAERIRMLRDHGQSKKYVHTMGGGNFRMDAFQGVVLGAKLKRLQAWNEARRAHAARYRELLGDLEVKLPRETEYAEHIYHLYVIQVTSRNALQAYLSTKQISTGLHYPVPLHLQEAYEGLGYRRGDFPAAERCAEGGLSLPMYPELREEQIQYVVEAIRDFLQGETA